MTDLLPRAMPGVIVQQQQDAWFLLDTEGGDVFNINATAASIFALCQSGATMEGAVQELARSMSASGHEAEILEDVRQTVRTFQELGLCEPSSPA